MAADARARRFIFRSRFIFFFAVLLRGWRGSIVTRGVRRLGRGRLESLDASAGGLWRTPMRRGRDDGPRPAPPVTRADRSHRPASHRVVSHRFDVGHVRNARKRGPKLWPIRAGSQGRKNKECGFNAQGPWLAPAARTRTTRTRTTEELSSRKDKRRRGGLSVYVVVGMAEPDAGVTVAGSDALGGGDGRRRARGGSSRTRRCPYRRLCRAIASTRSSQRFSSSDPSPLGAS